MGATNSGITIALLMTDTGYADAVISNSMDLSMAQYTYYHDDCNVGDPSAGAPKITLYRYR